jgi:hypothetical protein
MTSSPTPLKSNGSVFAVEKPPDGVSPGPGFLGEGTNTQIVLGEFMPNSIGEDFFQL